MQIIVKEMKMRYIQARLKILAARTQAEPLSVEFGKCKGQLPEELQTIAAELQTLGSALAQVINTSSEKVGFAATQYVAADESWVI